MGISYLKDSNMVIVKNNHLSNLKVERLFITSIIEFVILFVILLGYWEHYPTK